MTGDKGFTLVEIMIAISVFSIMIISLFGFFHSAFLSQEKSLNSIYLLDNASFLSEYMSRSIRMARKDINGDCIEAKANFYQSDDSHLKFLNYNGECQELFLQNGSLVLSKSGETQNLTPDDILVEDLVFHVKGGSQSDFIQPRVTFILAMKNKKGPIQSIKIQTTVSQRQLDIEY